MKIRRVIAYFVTYLILFLSGVVFTLTPAENTPSTQLDILEQSVLASNYLREGKYDDLVAEWLKTIETHPAEPIVEPILRLLSYYVPYLKDESGVSKRLEKILKDPAWAGLDGFNNLLIRRYLMDAYERLGEWDKRNKTAEMMGFIKNWAFTGPFGFTDFSVFDDSFPPEGEVKFSEAYLSNKRSVKWRNLSFSPAGSAVNFFDYLRPGHGAVYGLTQVKSESTRTAQLVIRCRTAYKIWLNGQHIFTADRLRQQLASEITLPIQLQTGWNQLMIKIIAGFNPEFTMQLVTPAWKPPDGIAFEKDLILHAFTTPATSLETTPLVSKSCRHYLKDIVQLDNPYFDLIAGLLCLAYGDTERAINNSEGALITIHPERQLPPAVFYWLSEVYRHLTPNNGLLPDSYRCNRLKEIYDRIILLDPAFVPAYYGRAEIYFNENKPEEALKELGTLLTTNPGCFPAYILASNICEREDWVTESEQYIRKANETYLRGTIAAGDHPLYSEYLATRAESERNYTRAEEYYRKLLPRPSALQQLMALYHTQGDLPQLVKTAREVLSHNALDLPALQTLAQAYTGLKDYPNALKSYQELINLVPEEPSYYQAIGDIYLKQACSERSESNQKSEAKKYYESALRLNPGNRALRNYLNAGDTPDRNGTDEFVSKYALKLKPLIEQLPNSSKFLSAGLLYLIDQAIVRIWPDGSHSEVIHEAYQILNPEVIEKYSKIHLPGEILEARVYQPDETVLEPTITGSDLTMPAIGPGSIIEYKYRQDFEFPPSGPFSFPAFYFQDPNYDAPFLLSQFIVIAPADFPLSIAQRNLDSKPDIINNETEQTRTYIWTVKNPKWFEPESYMPHYNETLPYVSIGETSTWQAVYQEAKEYFLTRTIVTDALRRQAESLITPTADLSKPAADLPEARPKAPTREVKSIRERAEALYYFTTNYIKDTHSAEATTASEIFTSKQGNRLTLLKALLDAAGIESYFAFVRQSENYFPRPDWEIPQLEYFTGEGSAGQLLYVVDPEKGAFWLCGDYRFLRFGELPEYVQGGTAFLLEAKSGRVMTVPVLPAETQRSVSLSELRPDATSGAAEIMTTIFLSGLTNARTKESLLSLDEVKRRQQVEGALLQQFPGAVFKDVAFRNLSETREPLRIEVTFTLPDFVTKTAAAERQSRQGGNPIGDEELQCKTGLVPLGLTGVFSRESKRHFPLQIKENIHNYEKGKLLLPSGYRLAETPAPFTRVTSFGTYSLNITSETSAGLPERGSQSGLPERGSQSGLPAAGRREVVTIERQYYLKPQQIPPEQYPEFIKFCRAIDQAETAELHLVKK